MNSVASYLILAVALAVVACGKEKTQDPRGGGSGGTASGLPTVSTFSPVAPAGLAYLGSVTLTNPEGVPVCAELRTPTPEAFQSFIQSMGSGFSATEKCPLDGVVGICEVTQTQDGKTLNQKMFLKGDAADLKAKCTAGHGSWTAL